MSSIQEPQGSEMTPLSVSAISQYIKYKFDHDPYLRQVVVTGEVTDFRKRKTHQYFALKDDNAKIRVTMFANDFRKIDFNLEDGMKVIITGYVSTYLQGGSYSLIAKKMVPDGIGALYQQFLKQKKALQQEGLFAVEHKKPLVKYPKKIAVITSREGAVIRDIITTVNRRYPIVQLVLYPAAVQGADAVASIVARLKEVNLTGGYDTIILGRGGGSLEDLWAFNETPIVRAIYESNIPVISSVGHETDTTLADLAADVRAATPTAAAELATPVLTDELANISGYANRLTQAMAHRFSLAEQAFQNTMSSYIFAQPARLYESQAQQLDIVTSRLNQVMQTITTQKIHDFQGLANHLLAAHPNARLQLENQQARQLIMRLNQAVTNVISEKQTDVKHLIAQLAAINPLAVLQRGYAVVQQDDKIIRSTKELTEKTRVKIRLADGTADAIITQINPGKND